MTPDVVAALDIRGGDLVALVGGGGKTSLLFALAGAWRGHALMTTTTRLGRDEALRAKPLLTHAQWSSEPRLLADALRRGQRPLLIAELLGDKALGVPPDQPGKWLGRDDVDLVVVEADGSRGLPVKAPAAHEPVIPADCTLVVIVAGLDALAAPITTIAHRPERVASLTGLPVEAHLTPGALAALLAHPEGGLKGVPAAARAAVILNKADSNVEIGLASQTALYLRNVARIDKVIVTALRRSNSALAVFSEL